MGRVAALMLLALAAAQFAPASAQLSLMIFTERGWTNVDFLRDAMTSLGVRAVVQEYWQDMAAADRPNITKLMRTADGKGPAHAGFAMYPNIEAMGYLNRSDVQELWAYQREYQARSVKFGAWPTYFGFTPTGNDACSSESNPLPLGSGADALRFTDSAPFNLTGVELSTKFLAAKGLYRCPGIRSQPLPTCSIWAPGSDFESDGLHPACSSREVMEFTPSGANSSAAKTNSTGLVAAMLVDYDEGYSYKRQTLAFVFDCAEWSYSCRMLGNLSVAYLVEKWGVNSSSVVTSPAWSSGGLVPPLPYVSNPPIGYAEKPTAGGELAGAVVANFLVQAAAPPANDVIPAAPAAAPKPAAGGARGVARGTAGAAAGAALLAALLL